MRLLRPLLVLLLTTLSNRASAQSQAPFQLPSDKVDRLRCSKPLEVPLRIAIIGAGAGGSSAAYHLRQAFAANDVLADQPLNITVYEASSRVGGRTTTINVLGSPALPVELGASIFVTVNHILYNATRDFGLATNEAYFDRPRESEYSLGVWDGASFVFTQKSGDEDSRWTGWWDVAKLLWRYGLAPIRTQRLMKDAIGRFLRFYDDPVFPFPSLTVAVDEVGLLQYTEVRGAQLLRERSVGEAFAREVVQASTRVNYAQNLAGIHGLETLVCMAIEGAMAVHGGNWQIFDEMVKRSAANLRLDSKVTDVVKNDDGTYVVKSARSTQADGSGDLGEWETDASSKSEEIYDTVILAAPYQFANITFTPALDREPETIPYVSLHVTLFTSPHQISPGFFGLPKSDSSPSDVPEMILTTLPLTSTPDDASGPNGVGPAAFWSISLLRVLYPASPEASTTATPQYLYKVFSPAPLTAGFVARLLGVDDMLANDTKIGVGEDDPITSLPATALTWAHEKTWNSYPYELPRTTFEELRLDEPAWDSRSTWAGMGKGVWYTSAIESFISTMETSALMGKNVAHLIANELSDDLYIRRVQDEISCTPVYGGDT